VETDTSVLGFFDQ